MIFSKCLWKIAFAILGEICYNEIMKNRVAFVRNSRLPQRNTIFIFM